MTDPRPHIGPCRQAGPFRIRRIDYPAEHLQPRHCHPAASMTVVLAGAIQETTRAGEAIGSALSVVVKPPGVEHANRMGPRGARTLQVTFAPEIAERLSDRATLARWRWLHAGPAAAPLLKLARALRSDGDRTTELEDRVLDAVGALDDGDPGGGHPPDWLARVREALDDELAEGIGVRELARRVDVHPVSVSRAFRRHYGLSVTDYRRRERVRRAADRVAASSLPLTRIAYRTGHADQPHFCREFRRLTGLTPSEFRRLARPG